MQEAIFEGKRRAVKMLIDRVLVVKEPGGGKKVIPILAIELPLEFAGLVYDAQSLDYRPLGLEDYLVERETN